MRLLRRVRDFADAEGGKAIDAKVADKALAFGGGLHTALDALVAAICLLWSTPIAVARWRGTLAAALAKPRLEEVIEPYLMQQGFVKRTPRGRCAAPKAYERLVKPYCRSTPETGALFGEE